MVGVSVSMKPLLGIRDYTVVPGKPIRLAAAEGHYYYRVGEEWCISLSCPCHECMSSCKCADCVIKRTSDFFRPCDYVERARARAHASPGGMPVVGTDDFVKAYYDPKAPVPGYTWVKRK